MALFGPPNVEKLKAKGNIEGLIKALGYEKSFRVRQAAAEALGQIGGDQAVEALIAALSDRMEDVRATVVNVLGHTGSERAIEPLRPCLKDKNKKVCFAAIQALGEVGTPQAFDVLMASLKEQDQERWIAIVEVLGQCRAKQAIPRLVAALKAPFREMRVAALHALALMGDPQVIKPLLPALREPDARIRNAVIDALEQLGWQPGQDEAGATYRIAKRQWGQCATIGVPALRPLFAALRENDAEIRIAAGNAIEQISDPRAIKLLLPGLGDRDAHVRSIVAKALKNLGWRPNSTKAAAFYWVGMRQWNKCVELGAPAVQPLLVALKDSDKMINGSAAEMLAKLGVPAVEPLIATLEDDKGPVRKAASDVLKRIGVPAVEPLIAALRYENHAVREIAADTLGWIGDKRAIEPLLAASKDEKLGIRGTAAGALVRLGNLQAIESLIDILKNYDNEEPPEREAAVKAFEQLGDPKIVKFLMHILRNKFVSPYFEDARNNVRVAAEEALRESYNLSRVVKHLITMVKHSCSDAAEVLRRVEDKQVVAMLILALRDDSAAVRRVAAEALGRIGSPLAVMPLVIDILRKEHEEASVICQAVEALGRIGDARVVGYLIATYKNFYNRRDSDTVRRAVKEALGYINNPQAVPALVAAFNDADRDVRQVAAVTVARLGDARAVEPLVALLKERYGETTRMTLDSEKAVCEDIVEALDTLGWQPDQSEVGAAYWIVKRQWDKLVDIGAPAVGPLLDLLHRGKEVRQGSAMALKELYHHGELDKSAKKKILASRKIMEQPHTDEIVRPQSDCDYHSDIGIGIQF